MKYERNITGVTIDKEFIMHADHPETFTVLPDGITPTEDGEYMLRKGTFVDIDGKVVTLSSSDKKTLTFSTPPIGIVTETLNITDHIAHKGMKVAASVMRRGLIQAEYLPYPDGVEYVESFKASIEEALPHILCYGPVAKETAGGKG